MTRHILNTLTPDQLRQRGYALNAQTTRPSWRMEAAGTAASLHIYGVIGGFWGDVAASDVVPAIRASQADTINVFINSPGGDVYDGIAIRNALRQHSARVVMTVDGLAASAASFIATAGDEVVMGANAEIMIHDAWTIAIGNAEDMRIVATDLDRISDNIAAMYAEKAGGDAGAWRDLMKAETWYSAEEAVAAGLADRLDTDTLASASFDLSMFAHAGRASAPAPSLGALAPAALAPNRNKENTMNRAQLAAALAAGTITQAQYDASIATMDAIEVITGPAPADVAPEIIAGPELQNAQPASPVQVRERSSVRAVARRLADEYNTLGTVDPLQRVQNVLADIIPADDAGEAFVNREDWIGETWRATDDSRPWIDAIGAPEQMTTLKGRGWRWGIAGEEEGDPELPGTPEVDEYAGDKTDVPSNEVGTLPVEFGFFRIAAGWDIDRAYFDFSEESFWTSFIEAATRDYKKKSNAKVRALVLAAVPDAATLGTADVVIATVGIQGVLKQLRRDVRRIEGAHANRIALGNTLFDLLEDLPEDDQPLWLRNASIGLGPEEGTADVGTLHIWNDTTLAATAAAAFDNRGIRLKERSPFWLRAENIPKGGVDVGVHSYGRVEIHDERVIAKRTY